MPATSSVAIQPVNWFTGSHPPQFINQDDRRPMIPLMAPAIPIKTVTQRAHGPPLDLGASARNAIERTPLALGFATSTGEDDAAQNVRRRRGARGRWIERRPSANLPAWIRLVRWRLLSILSTWVFEPGVRRLYRRGVRGFDGLLSGRSSRRGRWRRSRHRGRHPQRHRWHVHTGVLPLPIPLLQRRLLQISLPPFVGRFAVSGRGRDLVMARLLIRAVFAATHSPALVGL